MYEGPSEGTVIACVGPAAFGGLWGFRKMVRLHDFFVIQFPFSCKGVVDLWSHIYSRMPAHARAHTHTPAPRPVTPPSLPPSLPLHVQLVISGRACPFSSGFLMIPRRTDEASGPRKPE